MHPNSVDLLILLARLSQIACGVLILSFSIAATSRLESDAYGGFDDHDRLFASVFLGAGIALFGVFGIFGCRRGREDEDQQQVRLVLLILFIDCWALMLCLAAGLVGVAKFMLC